MDISLKSKLQRTSTLATAILWTLLVGSPALADDTEIFFGQATENPDNNPNVLLIIDTSGSMDSGVENDTRDRLRVVQDVSSDIINNLTDVNVGVMRFDFNWFRNGQGNESRSQGGMIVHEIADVEQNRNSLVAEINRMHHDGGTPLSETYHEAMLYFAGEEVLMGQFSAESFVDNNGNITFDSPRQSVPASRVAGNQDFYQSPITGACQRNYIIYLSDGQPTSDQQGTFFTEQYLSNTTDYPGHTSTSCANDHGSASGQCLDEIAEFLYENDFSDAPGQQNVISHFIGFALDLPIFEDAAEAGGGTYYRANNADDLRRKLISILREVADTDDGFTAPAVTVNAFDRTSHLDQLYFTVFKPSSNDRWNGNLKKYKFVPKANEDGLTIIDQNGHPAVDDSTGFFYSGKNPDGSVNPNLPIAHSFWSEDPDGANVQSGGAAGELTANRYILTNPTNGFTGTLKNHPVQSVNAFENRMDELHGQFPQANQPEYSVDEWIDWVSGIDILDADEDGDTDDVRQQIGAPLHSKPSVVVYGGSADNPDVKLFVGTNDGLLHAIDGATGEELWAFMPKDVWDIVPKLVENRQTVGEIPYGVDGNIAVYKDPDNDKITLIFGLRRGGNAYYALDITNVNNPKLIWRKASEGESWSPPVVKTVNAGTDDNPDPKKVVLLGGGYDPVQDTKGNYVGGSNGNSIHMLDLYNGDELWAAGSQSGDSSAPRFLTIPDMADSIPSAVRGIDMDLDGFMDRMYVNDINGRLFRFDLHTKDSNYITGGMIASLGGAAQGGVANNRRFYYAPDIALGSYEGTQFLTLTMASGHRASPLSGSQSDYLFGVRDFNAFNKLGVSTGTNADDDYDYDIEIDDLTAIPTTAGVLNAGSKGFKRQLAYGGEKSLAPSRIFQNKAYYTTYKPGSAPESNPCAPAVGSGKLVIVDLKTGDVSENALQKPGIPPEVTFLFGEANTGDADICFGSACTVTEPGPGGTYNPPEGTDGDDDNGSSERDVQCLAGPESCTAESTEVPQRTFWRQDNSD